VRHREGQRGWLLFFRFSSLLKIIICCRSFAEFGSSSAERGCWFLPLSSSHRILSILVVVVIDESRSGYVEKVNAVSGGVLAVRRRRRRVHHLRLSISVFKRRWQRWMTAMSLVLIFVVAMIVLVFDVPRRHFVVDKSVRVVQIRVRLRVAGERSRSAGHVHHLMMVKCSISTGHFHALLGRVRRRVTRSIIIRAHIIRGCHTRSHRTRIGRRRHLLFLLQKILRRRRRIFALPLNMFRVHVSLFINRRSNSQDVLRPRFRFLRLRVVVFV
jgi:hypothetical protein